MKIDYQDELLKVQKYKKLFLALIIILGILFVGVATILIIFSTYQTKLLIKIIGITSLSIILIIFINFLINGLINYKNEENGLFDILNSYQEEITGVIKEIKEDVHLPNNKVGHEFILINDKEEKIVYLPIFSDVKQIKINQKMKMIISKSFIISFEVIDDEK